MSDNLDAVVKHMSKYHGTAAKLTFPHCTKYVASAMYMLECHMQACAVKDKKVKFHHCDMCGKGFRDWDTFSRHKVRMHSAIPNSTAGWYFCGECDKKFVASSSWAVTSAKCIHLLLRRAARFLIHEKTIHTFISFYLH